MAFNVVRTVASRSRHVGRRGRAGGELEALIRRDGVAIVRDFLTDEQCALLRAEVDSVIDRHPETVWWSEGGEDVRVFGAERVADRFKFVAEDQLFLEVARNLMGSPQATYFVMANRILPGNTGSGGGWHRDVALDRQAKAIVYLTDVDSTSGPFEYFPRSNNVLQMARATHLLKLQYSQSRFSDQEALGLSEIFGPPIAVTGTRGTAILADTSIIHRGRPCRKGERYALTNYMYSPAGISHRERTGEFRRLFVDR